MKTNEQIQSEIHVGKWNFSSLVMGAILIIPFGAFFLSLYGLGIGVIAVYTILCLIFTGRLPYKRPVDMNGRYMDMEEV